MKTTESHLVFLEMNHTLLRKHDSVPQNTIADGTVYNWMALTSTDVRFQCKEGRIRLEMIFAVPLWPFGLFKRGRHTLDFRANSLILNLIVDPLTSRKSYLIEQDTNT